MSRDILTRENYIKLLNNSIYPTTHGTGITDENRNSIENLTMQQFCEKQCEKFSDGQKGLGTSLNLVTYLLAKYKGAILTCNKNNNKTRKLDVHYAFIYINEKGTLSVCDPAWAKSRLLKTNKTPEECKNNEIYFSIPLKNYKLINYSETNNHGSRQVSSLCANNKEVLDTTGMRLIQRYVVRLGINPFDNNNSLVNLYHAEPKIVVNNFMSFITTYETNKIKEEINAIDDKVKKSLKR